MSVIMLFVLSDFAKCTVGRELSEVFHTYCTIYWCTLSWMGTEKLALPQSSLRERTRVSSSISKVGERGCGDGGGEGLLATLFN